MDKTMIREPIPSSPLAAGYPISNYLRWLPRIFRSGWDDASRPEGAPFICRFRTAFEYVLEGFEQRQTDIDLYFDPTTCPNTVFALAAELVRV